MKNPALDPAVPDPTPALLLITAASVLLYFTDSLGWAGLLLPGIILLPALIYLLSSNLAIAAATLIVGTVLSRFFIPVSTLRARPEHIAVGLLCCLVPFVMKRRTTAVPWIAADFLLLLYIGLNIFSSAFASPEPAQTIRWAMQQTLAILPYFLLRIMAVDEVTFKRIFQLLLGIGVLQAAYAIVCFFSRQFFGTEFGIAPEQYGTIAGTYGVQLEPNILGSYSSACLVMLLLVYFTKPSKRVLAGIGITYAAAAISLSRAAIAGGFLAVLVLLYCGRQLQIIRKRALVAVGVTVLAVSLILAPFLVPMYVERFSTLSVTDYSEDTLVSRVTSFALAFEDIIEHPVLGTGTASFQVTFDWTQIDPDAVEGGWIGNSEIRILHDTGVLGLATFIAFTLFLFIPCWKLLRREFHVELLALAVASLVYCVSFQATEGTLMAFFWVHLGLISCALALQRQEHRVILKKAA